MIFHIVVVVNMAPRGERFTEEEIIVLSYLAKYNCKSLGFNYASEIYRALENLFGRKHKSSKAKYENLLYEYHINDIEKENPSNGRSGEQGDAKKRRETEKRRWKFYIQNWDESGEWHSRALSILMDDYTEQNFTEDETEYTEGKIIHKLHRVRERNGELVKKAKNKWEKKYNGNVCCKACGFSFFEKYGELGRGFIEAHHITPLSSSGDERNSRISDLVPLCANCHRMIHRLNDLVGALQDLIVN